MPTRKGKEKPKSGKRSGKISKKEKREQVQREMREKLSFGPISSTDIAAIASISTALYFAPTAFSGVLSFVFPGLETWYPGLYLKKAMEGGKAAADEFWDAYEQSEEFLAALLHGVAKPDLDSIFVKRTVKYDAYYKNQSDFYLVQASKADAEGRTEDAEHFRNMHSKYVTNNNPDNPAVQDKLDKDSEEEFKRIARIAFIAWCIATACIINNISKEISVSEIAGLAAEALPL